MITIILIIAWLCVAVIPAVISTDGETKEMIIAWLVWGFASLIWIVPIFTGVPVKSGEGQYKGYVTAVERNGAIFKVWNAYLKTELESSDEDVACVSEELVERIKEAQEKKENITLKYEQVWQYAISECSGSSWKVVGIK